MRPNLRFPPSATAKRGEGRGAERTDGATIEEGGKIPTYAYKDSKRR